MRRSWPPGTPCAAFFEDERRWYSGTVALNYFDPRAQHDYPWSPCNAYGIIWDSEVPPANAEVGTILCRPP